LSKSCAVVPQSNILTATHEKGNNIDASLYAPHVPQNTGGIV
jgi:hypothetical protein